MLREGEWREVPGEHTQQARYRDSSTIASFVGNCLHGQRCINLTIALHQKRSLFHADGLPEEGSRRGNSQEPSSLPLRSLLLHLSQDLNHLTNPASSIITAISPLSSTAVDEMPSRANIENGLLSECAPQCATESCRRSGRVYRLLGRRLGLVVDWALTFSE